MTAGDEPTPPVEDLPGDTTAPIWFKQLPKGRHQPAPGLEPGKVVADFRLVKIIGRYRRARPEELTAISSVLELPERLLAREKHSPSSERSPGSHVED